VKAEGPARRDGSPLPTSVPHVILDAEYLPELDGPYDHWQVTCTCGQSWPLSAWKSKFSGWEYVGGGGHLDRAHKHWACLVVTALAWGHADAVDLIGELQEAGTPWEWVSEWLVAQGCIGPRARLRSTRRRG
jgi:hypothetical protein